MVHDTANRSPLDESRLCPQLIGLEGCRVEVSGANGKRRFWVHRAVRGPDQWHCELAYRTSKSGCLASPSYNSVTVLVAATKGNL